MRQIGSPSIARDVVQSLTFSAVILAITLVSLFFANAERFTTQWWVALIAPAILSAIAIPARAASNTWAVVDTTQWLISINGGAFRPLAEIRYAYTMTFRGVSTLTLGFSDREKFALSAFTPWFSKKADREFVKYLLPYTGIPHDAAQIPSTRGALGMSTTGTTLPEAIAFADANL